MRLIALLLLLTGGITALAQMADYPALLDELQAIQSDDPADVLRRLDAALGTGDPQPAAGPALAAQANLYRLRAELTRSQSNYAAASADAERFAALAALSGDPALIGRAIFLRGTIEAEQGFFGRALEHFHHARQLIAATDNDAEMARVLNAIGMTHHFAGDPERAVGYYEQALAAARQSGDPSLTASYLMNLANVLADLDGLEQAIEKLREGLALAQRLDQAGLIGQAEVNLCNLLVLAELFEEAEQVCAQALTRADALDHKRWRGGVRLALGNLAAARGGLDEALDWYREGLALAQGLVPVLEQAFLERMAALHVRRNEAELAGQRYRELLEFRAAALEREHQSLREELEVRYQLERTQSELDLLRLSQALHDTQLRVRNISLIALGMILATTLLGAAMLVRTSRQRAALQQDLAKRNSELQLALEHISELAQRDPLTGLLNRRAMLERSAHELAHSRRQGSPISLLMCDVDHFKPINDAHGHAVGDEVLRALAARLRQSFRETDLVARWGGEEFLCVLPGTSVAEAEVSLARLRDDLARQPLHTSAGPISITLTWGVAELTRQGEADAGSAIAAAIRHADQALYQGKRAGRDRTVVLAAADGNS